MTYVEHNHAREDRNEVIFNLPYKLSHNVTIPTYNHIYDFRLYLILNMIYGYFIY
jgi:hypothetical protein